MIRVLKWVKEQWALTFTTVGLNAVEVSPGKARRSGEVKARKSEVNVFLLGKEGHNPEVLRRSLDHLILSGVFPLRFDIFQNEPNECQ